MGQLANKGQLIQLAQTIKQAYARKDDILEDGLIKSSLLPSYVDDVLEYAKKSSFPASGESGKIYVALDTNLTYRWSGTAYVEISKSLALGETSSTAYAGDKGKANADNIATLLGYFSSGITKAQLADAVQTSLGKADTAYQKPSTGIPKTDLASAVQTSLGKADTALQSHQTIYTLTIQRNGTQVDTYTPNSAAKTININAVTSITVPTGFSAGSLAAGGSLAISFASGYSLPTTATQTGWTNAKNLFEAMFERVGSGTTADPYIIRAKYGFYSDSFVSAGGLNPNAGGGGSGDVLGIKFGEDTIIGSTEGVLYVNSIPMTIISGLDSALGGKQNTISDLADIRSGAAMGATAVQDINYVHTDNNLTQALISKWNAKWDYNEITIQGVKVNNAAFADDLVPHDVVERTESFLRRESPADVKGYDATIKRIDGDTVVWNQRIGDTSLRSMRVSQCSKSIQGNDVTLTYTSGGNTYMYIMEVNTSPILGHKYLTSFTVKDYTSITHVWCKSSNNDESVVFPINKMTFGCVDTVKKSGQFIIGGTNESGLVAGSAVTLTNIIHIDLTQMFGAGNEPATYEEFLRRKPNVADEYAYNEGELVSVNPDGLKTVGRNLVDQAQYSSPTVVYAGYECYPFDLYDRWTAKYSIACMMKAGESYILSAKWLVNSTNAQLYRIQIHLKYADGTYDIKTAARQNTTSSLVPSTAPAYLALNAIVPEKDVVAISFGLRASGAIGYFLKDSLMINKGTEALPYEPYTPHTLDLSWIREIKDSTGNKLFPNGLLRAGNVRDEITATKAVKRVGVKVFDGTENWVKQIENECNRFHIDFVTPYHAKPQSVNLCVIGYNASSLKRDKDVNIRTVYIVFMDNSYDTADAWKAHLSELYAAGTPLVVYYELAEPTEISFDEQPMDYMVAETEEYLGHTLPVPTQMSYEQDVRDMVVKHIASHDDIWASKWYVNRELNAKQDVIDDLSSIRTNASLGAIANTWGNHANAGYLLSTTAANTYQPKGDYPKFYTRSVASLKGVRIKFSQHQPTVITASRSNQNGQLILIGTGYGASASTRNKFVELVSSSWFSWSLPIDSSISMAVDILHKGNNDAVITVITTGNITFEDIDDLLSPAQNATLITSTNYKSFFGTTTVDWSAKNLTLAGALSGATTGVFSSDLTVGGIITLNNGKQIYGKNTSGTAYTMLALSDLNVLNLGWGTCGAGYDSNICGNNIHFFSATSHKEGMVLTSGGNVGIGNTNPLAKLHILADVASGNKTFVCAVYPANPYGIVFRSYVNGDNSIQVQRISKDSETFNLLLQPLGGKVGIGTNSPSEKLDVNGKVKIGSVVLEDDGNGNLKVNGGVWTESFISAGGKNDQGGSGGGGDVMGITFDDSTIINSVQGVLHVGAAAIPQNRVDGLVSDLASKQATISDLATIRSNAANGNTAYGWGNHALQGYLTQHQDISGKQDKITSSNKLAYSLISGTPTSLPASDVYAWAKAATKPSYGWTEITGKPNVIAIKPDGVAEAGQYFDFHHTDDTTSDYNVRLACPNVSLQTVNLPSESGTLALTKDFLPLTGGTLTGTLTCEGLSVKYGDYGSRINLRYSSTNSGGYHCIYTQNDDSTIRFSATNSNGTSWTYQDYLLVTRDGNVAAKGWIRSGNGGYGVRLAADNTINGMNGNAYGNLYLQDASTNNLYLCTGGGKVGVGTNNPLSKLHVMGSAVTDGNTVSDWTGYTIYYSGDHTYRAGIAFKGNVGATDYLKIETYYGNICLMAGVQGVGGNVGIGTTAPASKLHVSGNILATGQITAGSASDIRLKDNITSLCNAASILRNLHGVEFDWNAIATENCNTLKGHDVGMIAQDVERYIPSAVSPIFEKYKRLDYTKLVPYLVEGWKGHDDEIARLKARVNKLEIELSKLR